jgi:hypothetical protein
MATAVRATSVVVTGASTGGGIVDIPHAFFLGRTIASDPPVEQVSR